MNLKLADYHIHTPYCKHAHGKIIDYVQSSIAAGLEEIGFSDHLGRYYLTPSQKKRYWDWGMSEQNLDRYISEIENVREIFKGRITIKTGLEIDYIEGAEEMLEKILSRYSFDFYLASIHCLPAFSWKHLATYTKKDTWPIYDAYFKMVRSAISSKIFDSIAHLDFIWRYVKWPNSQTPEVFSFIIDAIRHATENNVAVEINSNGYLWSQLYQIEGGDPFQTFLKSIHDNKARITVGSDAHKPEFVGKAFPEITALLIKNGITNYCTFDKRKRIDNKIEN